MERQNFTEKPDTILDLGTGYSNVHLNVTKVTIPTIDVDGRTKDQTAYEADVIRVQNPITRDRVIAAIVNEEFTKDFREAALRKGILDNSDSDYVRFNAFVNDVKTFATNAGLI